MKKENKIKESRIQKRKDGRERTAIRNAMRKRKKTLAYKGKLLYQVIIIIIIISGKIFIPNN